MRVKAALDLNYVVEVSSDLVHWYSGDTFTEQILAIDLGETQKVKVQDRTLISSLGKRFMRLRVSQQAVETGLGPVHTKSARTFPRARGSSVAATPPSPSVSATPRRRTGAAGRPPLDARRGGGAAETDGAGGVAATEEPCARGKVRADFV